MFAKIVTELRYADTFYQRLMLAVASTLYGLLSLDWLGVIFVITGAGLWWRIFDRRPRLVWGTLVNLSAATVWVSISAANIFIRGESLSGNVGEIMVSLTALFVLTRTDLTSTDKGAA